MTVKNEVSHIISNFSEVLEEDDVYSKGVRTTIEDITVTVDLKKQSDEDYELYATAESIEESEKARSVLEHVRERLAAEEYSADIHNLREYEFMETRFRVDSSQIP
jgi:predicted ribosome quality control (RQC) complex YloA/Tae2 family protein